MWIRREFQLCARMPSQRPATLNPRLPAAQAPASVPVPAVKAALQATPSVPGVAVAPAAKRVTKPMPAPPADTEESRAGGFHESSYELQSGLQITESEWPDDVTVPGALGDR